MYFHGLWNGYAIKCWLSCSKVIPLSWKKLAILYFPGISWPMGGRLKSLDWHGHGQVLLRFPSLPNMKVPLLPSEGGQVRGNTLSPGNPGKQSKRQQYNILISYNYIYMHILLELEYMYIIFLIYRKYRHIYIYSNIHVYLWLVACHICIFRK